MQNIWGKCVTKREEEQPWGRGGGGGNNFALWHAASPECKDEDEEAGGEMVATCGIQERGHRHTYQHPLDIRRSTKGIHDGDGS